MARRRTRKYMGGFYEKINNLLTHAKGAFVSAPPPSSAPASHPTTTQPPKTTGGRRRRHRHSKRRGGNSAIVPLALLGMQQLYSRKRKH